MLNLSVMKGTWLPFHWWPFQEDLIPIYLILFNFPKASSLLNYVPHGFSLPTYLVSHVLSFLTCSRASHALCLMCPRALRVWVPCVLSFFSYLVFYIFSCLTCLLSYVLSFPTCLVSHVLSLAPCVVHILRALVPYVLRFLRALVSHVLRALRALVASRALCPMCSRAPSSFMSPFSLPTLSASYLKYSISL